ncbi:MAG: cytochrome c [Bacteroidetes bacterium]|nr:cytochrome c [Bacteroidota bacterium]
MAMYEFPTAMAANVKAEFTKECDKGQALYNLTCAKCHNRKVKGRMVIPDFPADKLKGYELRVANGQHEANMPDEKITAEELVMISTFLNYKKKSGVPL